VTPPRRNRERVSSAKNSPVSTVDRPDDTDFFDVFASYNSLDRREVTAICRKLKSRGLRPWLDVEQLRPGYSFQEALEQQITASRAGAVFVGPSNIGPWQNREVRAFLNELVTRRCPVIPVLLSGATQLPPLPLFLRDMTWVDFRKEPDHAFERLVWGITGERPASFDEP
jgi:TIR domain